MVTSCSAFGCTNRTGKPGVSFHRFPTDPDRRAKWTAACRRKNWIPGPNARVCSDHFIHDKSDDRLSPDFIPTIFTFTESPIRKKKIKDLQNFERRKKTQEKRKIVPDVVAPPQTSSHDEPDATNQNNAEISNDFKMEALLHENKELQSEVTRLQNMIGEMRMNEVGFRQNNKKVVELTGLPDYKILKFVVDVISPFLSVRQELTAFQQLAMTLMILRNSCSGHLALMCRRLVPAVVFWPEREDLRSLPMSFRETFKNCACIIDCFEVKIEQAMALEARAQTYSHYKSNNTMKYLIGITPQGAISFISKGWGGRASDKHITLNSGLLDNLLPGDLILADRGFDLGTAIGMMHATLKIPAFTKGKKQLDPLDVENSRKLALQRIHVERYPYRTSNVTVTGSPPLIEWCM